MISQKIFGVIIMKAFKEKGHQRGHPSDLDTDPE
jgi:hypothetical protein